MDTKAQSPIGIFSKQKQSLYTTGQPTDLYAALDLGTNSCRMLIAQPKGTELHIVDSYSKFVRLGAGLEHSGALSRPAMARAIGALKLCQQKLARHQVSRMRLVATEACRRASNAAQFIRLVRQTTGLELEIIKPADEARFAVMSCAPLVSKRARRLLVIDIGGGSTELVWIDLEHIPESERPSSVLRLHSGFDFEHGDKPVAKVIDWISVPLGVVTLTDQFSDVRDDAANYALMSWHFEESLADFSSQQRTNTARSGFQIIGTSGTMTMVAASHLGLRRYNRSKVDGLRMTSDQIDAVAQNYLAMGPKGRRKNPCIGYSRHALVMSGIAILQALLRVWPSDQLVVADRGVREGLLYSQMCADGVLDDGFL